MKCSSPKRDKANQILTMKSLILIEIVKLFLQNFPTIQYVTVRKMTTVKVDRLRMLLRQRFLLEVVTVLSKAL